MKKINWNGIKLSIRRWHIGNYIRQLSIVVLGIVITFVGSDIISANSKQKEVATVMQLIKAELQNNQRKLLRIKNKIALEDQIYSRIVNQNYRYDNIPSDTLTIYMRSINSRSALNHQATTLDVLRNASLMQHISDKTFLLNLILTYESLESLETLVSSFYGRKSDLWDSITASMTEEDRQSMDLNNPTGFFETFLSYSITKNYLVVARGYFNMGYFDEINDLLNQSIRTIEENYE